LISIVHDKKLSNYKYKTGFQIVTKDFSLRSK